MRYLIWEARKWKRIYSITTFISMPSLKMGYCSGSLPNLKWPGPVARSWVSPSHLLTGIHLGKEERAKSYMTTVLEH